MNFDLILNKIRDIYNDQEGFIPLHAPVFSGNEKKYVAETIDSTFVSSVGEFVNRFEKDIAAYTGSKYAIAMVNGTAALQLALIVAGVKPEDEVITQPLTFIATANAITHAGAVPVFVDVDMDTMGMSPDSLKEFLETNTYTGDKGVCINKLTGRKIAACIPMHTFGFPLRISAVLEICNKYNITLIEDAAESLGSKYMDRSTGTFGLLGTLSFNGNKTITCGGGGAILTDNEALAKKAKHLSTTAKVPHPWEFVHDEVGYNYRMPNLNAALACAQLEQLPVFLESKREVSRQYASFFQDFQGVKFVEELKDSRANYWLNAILFEDTEQKEAFLKYSNEKKVMTRPIWRLMNRLPMYRHCLSANLENAEFIEKRIVNIPSSSTIVK